MEYSIFRKRPVLDPKRFRRWSCHPHERSKNSCRCRSHHIGNGRDIQCRCFVLPCSLCQIPNLPWIQWQRIVVGLVEKKHTLLCSKHSISDSRAERVLAFLDLPPPNNWCRRWANNCRTENSYGPWWVCCGFCNWQGWYFCMHLPCLRQMNWMK